MRKSLTDSLLKFIESNPDEFVVTIQTGNENLITFSFPRRPGQVADTCKRDILGTLNRAETRMTTMQILEAMARDGLEWSESTVKLKLAEMVDDGWIDNDQRSRPKGYGLTDLGLSMLG